MLNPLPQWSADSNEIVYTARNEDSGQATGQVVHLHSLSTGEDHEIYHALGRAVCTWAVQQPKLFCNDDAAEKTDLISIAADSGKIERLHTFQASRFVMEYASRDDRAVYMYLMPNGGDLGGELLRWEMATQRETILEHFPSTAWGSVSPDERWLIRLDKQELDIRPTLGGDWKPLFSLSKNFPTGTGHINATRDGEWVLYHDVDSAGKHSLFRIATAGGRPERLSDFPTESPSGSLEVSPDGRKIIVAAGGDYRNGTELWSLENFVPPAPKQ